MLDSLFNRFEHIAPLNLAERHQFEAALGLPQSYKAREIVLLEGAPAVGVGVVLSGFLCRFKTLIDGRRQIISCLMPGDMFNLQGLFIERGDYGVVTLAPSRLAYLTQAKMREMICGSGNIACGLWWSVAVEQSILREWLLNVGQRSAMERMAHFLCEMAARAEAAGLNPDGSSALPATQEDLADILGLSPVHVNRTLQSLRHKSLISFKAGRLEILNAPQLEGIGLFDADYLHLADGAEACGNIPAPGLAAPGAALDGHARN